MVGRHEDGDGCVRWLGHTPPKTKIRLGTHTESHDLTRGLWLLCVRASAPSGPIKNKLDFLTPGGVRKEGMETTQYEDSLKERLSWAMTPYENGLTFSSSDMVMGKGETVSKIRARAMQAEKEWGNKMQ